MGDNKTVRLSYDAWKRLKVEAAERDVPMGKLAEQAIERHVGKDDSQANTVAKRD